MSYCTTSEVKSAIDFPSTNAPVSDADIQSFIDTSEEEIEGIYKTKFGNIEDSGTADGDYATTTLSDSTKTGDNAWEVDEYVGYVVWIYGGTGEGQYSEIQSNTATKLTFTAVTTQPDATSNYRITKLGYTNETVDGSGTDTQFVENQPLINLNALTIDSTDITLSAVYQYSDTGKLVLSSASEETDFTDTYPQLVNMKYVHGVYPIPAQIKRLCVVIASIRTLTAQIAGTYDDFANVSLPGGLSASKGEPYMNIQSSLNYLQGEARGIIYGFMGDQVTADFRGTPSYRPFSLFK